MRYWKDFWLIGKTERQGFVVLLLLVLAAIWLPRWLAPEFEPPTVPDPPQLALMDSLDAQTENRFPAKKQLQPFVFDPNTIDKSGLLAMGLSEKTADSWLRFREKGGKFRKPEDIQKLYALQKADAAVLLPYVQLAANDQPVYERTEKVEATPKKVMVELNAADSLLLLQVPGIGPAYASRLLKARARWGGWHSTEQLRSIYGVDSQRLATWLPHIYLDEEKIRKLNINTDSLGALGRHPLIGFGLAKRLLAYRQQHGPFANPAALKAVYGIDSSWIRQISPYLEF